MDEFAQTTLDWSLIQAIVISLALGAIVGLERQSQAPEEDGSTIGVRTFALISLLGTVSVMAAGVAPALPWIAGAGLLALLAAYFVAEVVQARRLPGITTEISALLTFVFGAMVPTQPVLAASLAVIVALILSIKRYTHTFVSLLSHREIFDTLKFLLISVVLLPLLPNEPVDPWGIYNPREIWFLVVLITGISFLGYFAMRFMGSQRGMALTGVVGGFASSTAVTLAMAGQVREQPGSRAMRDAASFAILIANAIMVVRVAVIITVLNVALLASLWLPMAAMSLGSAAAAWVFWRRFARTTGAPDEPGDPSEPGESTSNSSAAITLENPFRLGPALKFGAIFLLIIGISYVAQYYLGDEGAYAAALVSGLADVDAVSLAMARMHGRGGLTAGVATLAIVLAVLSNSFVKAALGAALGSRRLGLSVALGMVPTLVLGLVAALVV